MLLFAIFSDIHGIVLAHKGLVSQTNQEINEAQAKQDLEEEAKEDSDEDGQKKHSKKDKVVKEKPVKLWIDRDIKVGEATQAEEAWVQEATKTFKKIHTDITTVMKEVKELTLEDKVKNEIKFASVRAQACGLILGLPDWKRLHQDQPNLAEATQASPPANSNGGRLL